MKDVVSRKADLAPLTVPGAWMIGPRSYLVDRFNPDLERVWLPERDIGGGQIGFEHNSLTFPSPVRDRGVVRNMRRHLRDDPPVKVDGPFFDMRWESPANWSHFIINHLTLLALVSREMDVDWRKMKILLPWDMPGYIRQVTELLELDAIFTDRDVTGEGFRALFNDWNVIRGIQGEILRDARYSPIAAALQNGRIEDKGAARRLFIARRGTRAVTNQDEIEALLKPQGFETIYPEDLSVDQEIRVFIDAEEIVGVEGAGLAPMAYRDPEPGKLRMVDVLPVGHITDFFRAMVADIKGHWCGVRGYIDADQIDEVYNLDQSYTVHSLRNFRVDPASVEAALEIVRSAKP